MNGCKKRLDVAVIRKFQKEFFQGLALRFLSGKRGTLEMNPFLRIKAKRIKFS